MPKWIEPFLVWGLPQLLYIKRGSRFVPWKGDLSLEKIFGYYYTMVGHPSSCWAVVNSL